jgi:protocatechuate 3,4-dioxygenase beta subunit
MHDFREKKFPSVCDYSRRKLLRLMGTAAAAALLGCKYRRPRLEDPTSVNISPSVTLAAEMPACVVRPAQTEGPYFVDEKLNRSDIRSNPSDGQVKPGVPLRLSFQVSLIDGTSCTPLNGAVIDVWHCDALGVYSDVRDSSFDTRGKKFLRGYQLTDSKGRTEFITIYPGWYSGRAVHIHFKIRTDPAARRGRDFTSQIYFDEAITDQVHSQPPYKSKGRRSTSNERDFIFRDGGKQLMLALTKEAQGYTAKFDIGLQIT